MVNSIRKSLLATQETNKRIDLIWRSRVRYLIANENKDSLAAGPKIFLHLVPLSSDPFSLDKHSEQLDASVKSLPLLFGQYPYFHRINFDGYLGYSTSGQAKSDIVSYSQVFWDGSIEFCDANYLSGVQPNDQAPKFSLPHFEFHFVKGLKAAIDFLKKVQAPLPIRLYLAILGVQGYIAIASQNSWPRDSTIDRNELFFDPITLDDWELDLGRSLRPIFDQLWNTGDFQRSFSYDENGDWKPRN